MTRNPFGQTLLDISTVSAIFWAVALIRVEYVGPVAVFIAASCGVLWLAVKIRRAFSFGSNYAVAFIAGETAPRVRPEPIIPHNLKDPATGRFISRKAAMRAALERAVEAGQ